MGPSRAWVEDAILPVAEPARPAARLGLLVALASFQVDDDVVKSFESSPRATKRCSERLPGPRSRQRGAWGHGSVARTVSGRRAAHHGQGSLTQLPCAMARHDGR